MLKNSGAASLVASLSPLRPVSQKVRDYSDLGQGHSDHLQHPVLTSLTAREMSIALEQNKLSLSLSLSDNKKMSYIVSYGARC